MSYEALHGLKPEYYQHPGENTAMAIMKKIPLLDTLVKQVIDMSTQMTWVSKIVGDQFRITEKTNPRIYNLYHTALRRLDMPEEYPLYCQLGYDYNAFTTGIDKPIIVLNSSMINALTDDELLFTIGHELGHIKSGHMLYHSMAKLMTNTIGQVGKIGNAASVALYFSLMEWMRNAEYTCDRAGLIATGSIDPAITMTMKLMGHSNGIPFIDFSVDEVLKQEAEFYEASSDLIGKILYVSYTATQSHPWSVLRLKQIKQWYDSGEYSALIERYSKH